MDRLDKYITRNRDAKFDLAIEFIEGISMNNVQSFASFYKGRSLYELNFTGKVNFKASPNTARKVE